MFSDKDIKDGIEILKGKNIKEIGEITFGINILNNVKESLYKRVKNILVAIDETLTHLSKPITTEEKWSEDFTSDIVSLLKLNEKVFDNNDNKYYYSVFGNETEIKRISIKKEILAVLELAVKYLGHFVIADTGLMCMFIIKNDKIKPKITDKKQIEEIYEACNSIKSNFNVFQSFEKGKDGGPGQINFYINWETGKLIDYNKEKESNKNLK